MRRAAMRRGGWREHVRAELQAREGRLRGLRRLLERHEQLRQRLEAQRPGGGASGTAAEPPAVPRQVRRQEGEQAEQQVALLPELLRSAEAASREQRARLDCLARDMVALTRQHQEAECRAWMAGRLNEELRAELGQVQAQLREAQTGRLALEACWLQEKALEATPDVELDGREGSSLSTYTQEEEDAVAGTGSESAEEPSCNLDHLP